MLPNKPLKLAWSVTDARFMVVRITRQREPTDGSVFETADSTLYVLRSAQTHREAAGLARAGVARIFGVRPNWSMPAPEGIAADSTFWRLAPVPRSGP